MGAREAASRRPLGAVLAASLLLSGCSFSIPSLGGGPKPEDQTGSIAKPAEQKIFADLGPEDWRRAKAALAVALDPQGNGRPVKWDNPDTALAGEFTPAGAPFVVENEICRRFVATVDGVAVPRRSRSGGACRVSADDWAVKDLGPPT